MIDSTHVFVRQIQAGTRSTADAKEWLATQRADILEKLGRAPDWETALRLQGALHHVDQQISALERR